MLHLLNQKAQLRLFFAAKPSLVERFELNVQFAHLYHQYEAIIIHLVLIIQQPSNILQWLLPNFAEIHTSQLNLNVELPPRLTAGVKVSHTFKITLIYEIIWKIILS